MQLRMYICMRVRKYVNKYIYVQYTPTTINKIHSNTITMHIKYNGKKSLYEHLYICMYVYTYVYVNCY